MRTPRVLAQTESMLIGSVEVPVWCTQLYRRPSLSVVAFRRRLKLAADGRTVVGVLRCPCLCGFAIVSCRDAV